ncbi:MAG: 6,7-dimethyl-8-ribityllumazine synthase [Acidobacteriaceae bacterium]
MIKGITLTRSIRSEAHFERLTSFLAALGFEPGKGWDDSAGKGRPFLAPIGNLEIVRPAPNATRDFGAAYEAAEDYLTGQAARGAHDHIYIEVTSLDSVRQAAESWLAANPAADAPAKPLTEVADTHWKSRLFTANPVPGFSLTFWEWADPLKGRPLAIEGDLSAAGMRFAIVTARWNAVITDRLLQGALDALHRSGAAKSDITIVRVPGAWEIPSAARKLAETGSVDAVITLGVLLRGETAHYEAIYNEVSRGIGQSQQETGIPHAFGVLTCENLEQALDRAGVKAGNKGFEAAIAAIEMVSIHRKIAAPKAELPQ